MTSYLSEAEVTALQFSDLDRAAPFLIRGVTEGIFSVARYYGGAKYNGASYTYVPATDELIRDDVLKFVAKLRKPRRKSKRVEGKGNG